MPKLPPIYIYGVRKLSGYAGLSTSSSCGDEQYICKALPNDTIKVNAITPDIHRKILKLLQQAKIVHHTYQVKDEQAKLLHGTYITLFLLWKYCKN